MTSSFEGGGLVAQQFEVLLRMAEREEGNFSISVTLASITLTWWSWWRGRGEWRRRMTKTPTPASPIPSCRSVLPSCSLVILKSLAIMLHGNPQKSCHHAAWWSSNLQGEEDSIVAANGHIKQVNIDSPMNLTKLRILSFLWGFSVCVYFFEAFLSDILRGRPLQHTTQVFIVERHMIDLFLSSTLYFQKVCKLLWNLQLP